MSQADRAVILRSFFVAIHRPAHSALHF